MFRFLSTSSRFKILSRLVFQVTLQPDLSGNPFFCVGKAMAKKDWERKAEIAAIKNES
jgi:hypothetical protein